jgi:hypothetical protein
MYNSSQVLDGYYARTNTRLNENNQAQQRNAVASSNCGEMAHYIPQMKCRAWLQVSGPHPEPIQIFSFVNVTTQNLGWRSGSIECRQNKGTSGESRKSCGMRERVPALLWGCDNPGADSPSMVIKRPKRVTWLRALLVVCDIIDRR